MFGNKRSRRGNSKEVCGTRRQMRYLRQRRTRFKAIQRKSCGNKGNSRQIRLDFGLYKERINENLIKRKKEKKEEKRL